MTRPYVRVIVFLFVGCTIGLLLIATKIAESIPGKVVRATYRKSGKHGHPEIAQFYEDLNSAASSIQPIPKILHHVYLDGLANLQQAESGEVAKPGQRFPGYNSTWRHSCHIVHPNWQYMFWNNSQAENLIRTAYPWFLATFQSYNNYVQKGDALRPFLMHAIGGMYLDIDVECFSPTDALLSGREVVLQLEDSNPKSLNNAVMASIPGHPFWIKVIQLMLDRGSTANERNLFGLRDLGTVLKTTGPYTIRDAFRDFSDEAGGLQEGWAGHWMVRNTSFHIYPMGQWFEPCKWDDYKCHAQIQAADDQPAGLVGHHINSGAWLKELKRHNKRLVGAWLLGFTACFSGVFLCWRIRRQANLAQTTSPSPYFI